MNRFLWILQIALGLFFLYAGINHFILPDGLPSQMDWMYDLSDGQHLAAGLAEILGGLGLILPAVTGIRTELVSLAAVGLILVMIGAVVFHIDRGETPQAIQSLILIVVLGFIGWGRWKVAPHRPGTSSG